jgi:hypothetical protein
MASSRVLAERITIERWQAVIVWASRANWLRDRWAKLIPQRHGLTPTMLPL